MIIMVSDFDQAASMVHSQQKQTHDLFDLSPATICYTSHQLPFVMLAIV